jgi:hypothetical protein
MKAGSFAFIMSSPRQDVLCKMILNLIDAGFETNFTSIYWTYASGFPKAANVSKLVDKRNGRTSQEHKELGEYLKQKREKNKLTKTQLGEYFKTSPDRINHGGCVTNWEYGLNVPTKQQYEILKQKLDLDNRFDELVEREEAEREIIAKQKMTFGIGGSSKRLGDEKIISIAATEAAKKLDGAYCGAQLKPAVEVILVVMKPLSEKSYVDQALKNGKGVTWLDDCRIPIDSADMEVRKSKNPHTMRKSGNNVLGDYSMSSTEPWDISSSRFPANLLVSDDSLNDGKISKSTGGIGSVFFSSSKVYGKYGQTVERNGGFGDSGSYSRYFDLDKWYSAQFIITPKASASERNKGLENNTEPKYTTELNKWTENDYRKGNGEKTSKPKYNHHPTVKPLKLMSYLITLGSRENDIVLDPFCGSGTTCIAALTLGRKFIGIELEKEYCEIARKRLEPYQKQTNLLNF